MANKQRVAMAGFRSAGARRGDRGRQEAFDAVVAAMLGSSRDRRLAKILERLENSGIGGCVRGRSGHLRVNQDP